jgi:hypothetical protein
MPGGRLWREKGREMKLEKEYKFHSFFCNPLSYISM